MAMPRRVLIRQRASAPASAAAVAISTMLVTLGVSLTMTGSDVAFLTAAVTEAAAFGSVPNSMPPDFTLGQPMFTSRPLTPATPSSRAASGSVVSDALPGDVDDDRHLPGGPQGRLLPDQGLDADVLEADRVEQSGRGLGQPRRRIALPRLQGSPFADDGSQPLDVDEVGVLRPVPEGAGRGHHRVGEPQPAGAAGGQLHRQVHLPHPSLQAFAVPYCRGIGPRAASGPAPKPSVPETVTLL